jgi:hypothetical protein
MLIELSEYTDVKSIKIYEWVIYAWLLGDILEEYRGVSSSNTVYLLVFIGIFIFM